MPAEVIPEEESNSVLYLSLEYRPKTSFSATSNGVEKMRF
jgi:hypothetical protein